MNSRIYSLCPEAQFTKKNCEVVTSAGFELSIAGFELSNTGLKFVIPDLS